MAAAMVQESATGSISWIAGHTRRVGPVGRVTEIVGVATTAWRATADLLECHREEAVASPWQGADETRHAAEEIAFRIQDAFRVVTEHLELEPASWIVDPAST